MYLFILIIGTIINIYQKNNDLLFVLFFVLRETFFAEPIELDPVSFRSEAGCIVNSPVKLLIDLQF